MSFKSSWSCFFAGLAVGIALPHNAKAACVEQSASMSYCSSTAPMPTHKAYGVLVITGDLPSALTMQNASDQTLRDNAATVQAQVDWQRYLTSVRRLNNSIGNYLND